MEAIQLAEQYYQDIKELKFFFIRNCQVHKKYEAYKIWAHWLIRNLCENQVNYHLIPGQMILQDTDILQHLKDKGCPLNHFEKFYQQVTSKVLALYRIYHDFKMQQLTQQSFLQTMVQMIEISTYQDGATYWVYQFKDIIVRHNAFKYHKLLSRYQGDPQYLNFYMFEVGFNYYILDGHSLQWCLPLKVFQYLTTHLQITCELFASPINVCLSTYCSLFVVDQQFGSLDSFFNLDVTKLLEGTYEVNPPFIEKIFINSSHIILQLLETCQKQDGDLLFVYIMPGWLDSYGYQLLKNNVYLIDEIILLEKTHYYYQSSNDRMVLANFQTHVMLLGTTRPDYAGPSFTDIT